MGAFLLQQFQTSIFAAAPSASLKIRAFFFDGTKTIFSCLENSFGV